MTDQCRQEQCEHDWVHYDTTRRESYNGYATEWTRYDWYYCRKCLAQEKVKKYEFQRERPDWW